MQPRHESSMQGFTLIELGIVLVIATLILSGILVGKNIIDAADARTIISERNFYTTAFKEFVDKYRAIPGDMSNAESIWGADASCPSTPTNTVAKSATCNGGGDGIIGDWTNTAVATAGSQAEWFRAWQQLANAELIEGAYTGVSGTASTETSIGVNVPVSKTGKAGWTLMYMISTTDNNFYFASVPVASHVLIYGAQTTSSFTDSAALSPSYAKGIDDKIDDGMPYTGNVRAKRSTAATCAVSSATTSDYLLTADTRVCQLLFLMGL